MSTEYTSKDNEREILEKLHGRLVSYEDLAEDTHSKLEQLLQDLGLTSPMYFYVDLSGDFWVYYDDGFNAPNVTYEPETGDMYWNFYVLDEQE